MSDRGRKFESNLWASIMLLLGIKRNRTTAYHPQSNDIVERFYHQLKASLKAPSALQQATLVIVRCDAVKGPLQ